MDPWVGRTLKDVYRLDAVLGYGGFAAVYRATHLRLEVERAIKVLHTRHVTTPHLIRLFVREAQLAARLHHPQIVQVYDVEEVEAEGLYFIVMELLRGQTLGALLATEAVLSGARAVDLLRQVAEALDYAHDEEVVHRDVKPLNVFITAHEQVKVLDFGLGRARQGLSDGASGFGGGTLPYIAPEVVSSRVDDDHFAMGVSADGYALGVMAYEMLTGHRPFEAYETSDAAVLNAHLHVAPPAPRAVRPELPAAAEPVLLRQLAKEPAPRYATAVEFVAALSSAWPAHPAEETPSVPPARVQLSAPPPAVIGASTPVLLRELPRHASGPPHVTLSSDGQVLATTAQQITVLWRVADGQQLRAWQGQSAHQDPGGHRSPPPGVSSAAFSPDGQLLATSWDDGKVQLWRTTNSELVRSLEGYHPTFSPNGQSVATAGADETVRLWRVADWKSQNDVAVQVRVHSLAFSPDGQLLAISGNSARGSQLLLLRVADGLLNTLHSDVGGIAFSPDGQTLAVGGRPSSRPMVGLWRVHGTTRGYALRHLDLSKEQRGVVTAIRDYFNWWPVNAPERDQAAQAVNVAFSPDGQTLLVGRRLFIRGVPSAESVRLWRLGSGEQVTLLSHEQGAGANIALSKDGHTLATGSLDGAVRLWRV